MITNASVGNGKSVNNHWTTTSIINTTLGRGSPIASIQHVNTSLPHIIYASLALLNV